MSLVIGAMKYIGPYQIEPSVIQRGLHGVNRRPYQIEPERAEPVGRGCGGGDVRGLGGGRGGGGCEAAVRGRMGRGAEYDGGADGADSRAGGGGAADAACTLLWCA